MKRVYPESDPCCYTGEPSIFAGESLPELKSITLFRLAIRLVTTGNPHPFDLRIIWWFTNRGCLPEKLMDRYIKIRQIDVMDLRLHDGSNLDCFLEWVNPA